MCLACPAGGNCHPSAVSAGRFKVSGLFRWRSPVIGLLSARHAHDGSLDQGAVLATAHKSPPGGGPTRSWCISRSMHVESGASHTGLSWCWTCLLGQSGWPTSCKHLVRQPSGLHPGSARRQQGGSGSCACGTRTQYVNPTWHEWSLPARTLSLHHRAARHSAPGWHARRRPAGAPVGRLRPADTCDPAL